MSKLLNGFSDSNLKWTRFRTSISRISSFSTQTRPVSSALYRRLQRCCQRSASLTPVLDKWVVEGRPVDHRELKSFVISFRKTGRFKPALEIAEWMSERKCFDSKPRHISVQLDLISKVHGLNQAEHYFNSLDGSLLVLPVYGALLNCYADAKALEKAEAVMDKIRKLNSWSNLVYNTMLSLYSRMGKHEKLDSLMQEMEDKGIAFNEFTYNIRLNAYATKSEMEKMEKLLLKMEADPEVTLGFVTYTTVAKGYRKAGASKKALSALIKAEHLIKCGKIQNEYGILITIYATMREKENVYRLWDSLRQREGRRTNNGNYVCMITSLEKLNDLEGIGKILEEWEEKNKTSSDIQIPNLALRAFCKRGCVREAEGILERNLKNGKEPSPSTWSHMALGYCKNGEMDEAVKMTKRATSVSFPEWKPDISTVAACLEYLKRRGDEDGMQEILMQLEKCGKFGKGFKERIERYAYSGKPRAEALEVGAS